MDDNIRWTSERLTLSGPQYVGSYEIAPGIMWTCARKPRWFHRQMTRLFFGWVWTDY